MDRRAAILLTVLLVPGFAHGTVITIDDAASVAEHASLVAFRFMIHDGDGVPVADPFDGTRFAVTWHEDGDTRTIDHFDGLGVFFRQPVLAVAMTARQVDMCDAPAPTSLLWALFDDDGHVVDWRSAQSTGCNAPLTVRIDVSGTSPFIIGGAGDAIFAFERLEARLATVGTPHPLMLMLIGWVALLVLRLRLTRAPVADRPRGAVVRRSA
jgi:hypothetical protein